MVAPEECSSTSNTEMAGRRYPAISAFTKGCFVGTIVSTEGQKMRKEEQFRMVTSGRQRRAGPGHRMASCLLRFWIFMMPVLMAGCGNVNGELQGKATFEEATALFGQGNYQASLGTYEQLIEHYPEAKDRVLFEMGVIYSYPKNERKDYQKSLDCFQRLVREHPASDYRRDSEMMIFNISNVALKDRTIAAQQSRIESLTQEIRSREEENGKLRRNIKALEQMAVDLAARKRAVDKILIKKKTNAGWRCSQRVRQSKPIGSPWGETPTVPRKGRGTTRPPRGSTPLTPRTGPAIITCRFMFPIPTTMMSGGPEGWGLRRAAIS